GLTLIFGIVELVNFSHADYLMVAMYITWLLFSFLGINPYLAMPAVTLAMALVGFVFFKVVLNRVLHKSHFIQVMATLSMMMILQNAALMIFKADFRSVRIPLANAVIKFGGLVISVPKLIAFIVSVTVCIALYLFLTKTYTGTSMRAISQNNKAAKLMGIKLDRTYCLTFVMGIAMTGIAACVLVPIYSTYPTVGGSLMLPAFVVVTIGGLSSIPGALIAGLLVGVIESMSAYFLGATYQQLAYFVIFILIVLFKPEGILARSQKKGGR
ncbi:MAG: branched-chain amino acid ABC transporter permease, partial [Eubacteriales bacterium]|nr:branched-chain amino acid ABC transporter permease [Eubacteriales bacterium]